MILLELSELFHEHNRLHFDGLLSIPELAWNSRLRSSAGRFFPGVRRGLWMREPRIEIATYLREHERGRELIVDTLGHEMIHYWLWFRRRPYGHTEEFHTKMKLMGVNRYNTAPCERPYKHWYRCPACQKEFPARKKLGVLACAKCCKEWSGGKFDRRFMLEKLEKSIQPPQKGESSK